jgi:hypothetical protein
MATQDWKEARSWFLASANVGVPGTSRRLSRFYKGNHVEALFWFLKNQPVLSAHRMEEDGYDCSGERWPDEAEDEASGKIEEVPL